MTELNAPRHLRTEAKSDAIEMEMNVTAPTGIELFREVGDPQGETLDQ